MRFLFVYQDFAGPAQALIRRMGVSDVTLVIVRKWETAPNDAERELLDRGDCAPAAICQVLRKYKRFVEPFVKVEYEAKKFRSDDQQLEAWLRNEQAVAAPEYRAPSIVFRAHAESCTKFKLADTALNRADELDPCRWPFANKAADLLLRYVVKGDTGPMREWKVMHGVDFAPNGQVRFECGGSICVSWTEWHLTEGNRTTAERAARIYFHCSEANGDRTVVVFYVGPHPEDGQHKVHLS